MSESINQRMAAVDADDAFVIDSKTLKIIGGPDKTNIPQHSKNSEIFSFYINTNMIEGFNLGDCNSVMVHYQNIDAKTLVSNPGIAKVTDLMVASDNSVTFSWTLGPDATEYAGSLIFSVRFAVTDESGKEVYALPTFTYSKITVGETVWNSETVAREYPDIIAEFDARLSVLENSGGAGGSGLFLVSVAHNGVDSFVSDKTYGELAEAMAEEKPVLGIFTDTETGITEQLLGELHGEDGELRFLSASGGGYIFYADGSWEYDPELAVNSQPKVWEACEGELQLGLLKRSGVIDASYDGFHTRIVELESGASYRITVCASEEMQIVHFRDAAGNILKRIAAPKPESGTYQRLTDYALEVPVGAATVYVCSAIGWAPLGTEAIVEKLTQALSLRDRVVKLEETAVRYDIQLLTKAQSAQARSNIGAAPSGISVGEACQGELQVGLMGSNGTVQSSYDGFHTRIVELEPDVAYRVTVCASEGMNIVHFRDAGGSILKKITAPKPESGTYQRLTDYALEVPAGAATVYVCSAIGQGTLGTEPIVEKLLADATMQEAVEELLRKSKTETLYTPLKNKTIVNFGDSIFGKRRPPNDISTRLGELTGATVHNCGFGGCHMSNHWSSSYTPFSMCNLADAMVSGDWTAQEAAASSGEVSGYFAEAVEILKSLDFGQVDIITIAYGTNDFTSEDLLDDADNPKSKDTFAGALRYSIETLLAKYPNLRIFLCSQTYRFWMDENNAFTDDSDQRVNGNGNKLTDFVAKTKELAAAYHLPYINNYDIGMNKFNRSQYFSETDGTHPQLTGCHLIAAHMAKHLY